MRKQIAFCFAALMLTSCANLTVNRNDTPAAGESTEIKLSSFLEGFVPGRKIPPASSLCPNGRVESIALGMNGGDVMLTMVTLGVFVPHRATVTCGK